MRWNYLKQARCIHPCLFCDAEALNYSTEIHFITFTAKCQFFTYDVTQKRPNPLSEVSTCVCLWAGGSRKQKVVPAHSCTVGGGTLARSCSDSANHHRRRIWGSGARSQSEFESRKRADRYDVFFFTFNKTWAYFSHKHCSDQSTVELKVFLVSCIECLFHLITVKLATELTFTLHAPSL